MTTWLDNVHVETLFQVALTVILPYFQTRKSFNLFMAIVGASATLLLL